MTVRDGSILLSTLSGEERASAGFGRRQDNARGGRISFCSPTLSQSNAQNTLTPPFAALHAVYTYLYASVYISIHSSELDHTKPERLGLYCGITLVVREIQCPVDGKGFFCPRLWAPGSPVLESLIGTFI